MGCSTQERAIDGDGADSVPRTSNNGAVADAGHAPTSAPVVRPLCVGGNSVFLDAVTAPLGSAGSSLRSRNGLRELYVTADCEAWVSGDKQLQERRHLTLTPAQADLLSSALRYAEWPGWYGWLGPMKAFDGVIELLSDGAGAFGCQQGCDSTLSAQEGWQWLVDDWSALFASYRQWRAELYQAGQPVGGPVRVKAYAYGNDNVALLHPASLYQWPAATPIGQVSWPTADEAPPGGALIDGQDAELLRGLRSEANQRAYSGSADAPPADIFILDGDTVLVVDIDDTFPFEDPDGRVPRVSMLLSPPGL